MYGIDFGTSNTVVSTESGGISEVVDMGGGKVVPSLLYFEKEKLPAIGNEAVAEYTEALGRWSNSRDLYKHFRFFQALKLALKDEHFRGSHIFGKYWTGENLVGLFLREVKRKADAATGRPERSVVLGRPVRLAEDPVKDGMLQDRFRDACHAAGFEEVHFVAEPVAATASLLGKVSGCTLVFDFGGGTLDITVAKISGASIDVLASVGADLGGYILDEDFSRARIIGHFGYGSQFRTMTGKFLEIPRWITNQVASFYALPLSDIAKTRHTIRELMHDAERKDELRGLNDFLDRNQAFGLFREIDEAKIALSSDDSADVSFDIPPHVSIHEHVTRPEFEAMIAGRIAAAEKLVAGAMEKAGVGAADIAHVVRVGGSSRVPAFVAMLERLFPGKVREGEVFTSISSGLVGAYRMGLGTES